MVKMCIRDSPKAVRCAIPPESCAGKECWNALRPKSSKSFSSGAAGRLGSFLTAKAMLALTVSQGISRGS